MIILVPLPMAREAVEPGRKSHRFLKEPPLRKGNLLVENTRSFPGLQNISGPLARFSLGRNKLKNRAFAARLPSDYQAKWAKARLASANL